MEKKLISIGFLIDIIIFIKDISLKGVRIEANLINILSNSYNIIFFVLYLSFSTNKTSRFFLHKTLRDKGLMHNIHLPLRRSDTEALLQISYNIKNKKLKIIKKKHNIMNYNNKFFNT